MAGSFETDDFKEHLRWAEGTEQKPYEDSLGHLTIGVGRLLEKGLSEDEIELLLDNDVAEALRLCRRLDYWADLSWPRSGVVADMAFNLGVSFLRQWPRFHAAMRLPDYKLASYEMENSRWYEQVGRRSRKLVRVMRTNNWDA